MFYIYYLIKVFKPLTNSSSDTLETLDPTALTAHSICSLFLFAQNEMLIMLLCLCMYYLALRKVSDIEPALVCNHKLLRV